MVTGATQPIGKAVTLELAGTRMPLLRDGYSFTNADQVAKLMVLHVFMVGLSMSHTTRDPFSTQTRCGVYVERNVIENENWSVQTSRSQ